MEFKSFLLTEGHEYLAHRIGDILTSVHELVSAGKQVGTRQLVRQSELIVNQIRKVLHSSWGRGDIKHLKKLQKCGVAIMKSIEEGGELADTLNSVRGEIEKVVEKMGMPINHMGTPDDAGQKAGQSAPPPPQQPPATPQQPPPPPQQPPQ